jgi:hypothetical protein
MGCTDCRESRFRQKLGRCISCIRQLTLLSVIGWSLWFASYLDTPRSVESIALLFFCFAFSGLLLVHLWLRYLWRPLVRRLGKSR